MRPDCAECRLRWSEYGAAIKEHIRVLGKLQVAVLQYDQEAVARLKSEVNAADRKRVGARDAIRRHDEMAHVPGNGESAIA